MITLLVLVLMLVGTILSTRISGMNDQGRSLHQIAIDDDEQAEYITNIRNRKQR